MSSPSPTLLFICSNANQLHIFQPVAEEFTARGFIPHFLGFDAHYHLPIGEKVRELNCGTYHQLQTQHSINNWWSIPEEELSPLLREAETAIEHIFEAIQPSIVITGNDYGGLEQLGLRAAERRGAVTVRIQDGIQIGHVLNPSVTVHPASLGDGGCDLQCTWGETFAGRLRKRGAPGTIVATGNPAHDTIAFQTSTTRSLPPYRVLVAAQNYAGYGILAAEEELEVYRNICKTILSREDLSILLKPHPSTPLMKDYASLVPELGDRVSLADNQPALSLFENHAVDLVVTITSTVAFDAALFTIPVVKLAGIVNSPEEQKAKIHAEFVAYLSNPQFPDGPPLGHRGLESIVAEQSVPVDGGATRRVVAQILATRNATRRPSTYRTLIASIADLNDITSQKHCILRSSKHQVDIFIAESNPGTPTQTMGTELLRSLFLQLQQATQEFVVFVPARCRLLPKAVDSLVASLHHHPKAVVALGWCAFRNTDGVIRALNPLPARSSMHQLLSLPTFPLAGQVFAIRTSILKNLPLPQEDHAILFLLKLISFAVQDLDDPHRVAIVPQVLALTDYTAHLPKSSVPKQQTQRRGKTHSGPQVSVILCSYNRADKVRQCLEALNQQTTPTNTFEVICVNDGSEDQTGAVMQAWLQHNPGKYIEHPSNRALAAARNSGLNSSSGELVLFINDDTYLAPDCIQEHLRAHAQLPETSAVLGFIPFHQRWSHYLLSRVLSEGNLYFGFHNLPENVPLPFWNFITGNLSVPKKAFDEHHIRFDEDFRQYGYEDIECGYRLWKKGFRVYYHSAAIAYHDHFISIDEYIRREKHNARSAIQFALKHPNHTIAENVFLVPSLSAQTVQEWKEFVQANRSVVLQLQTEARQFDSIIPKDRTSDQQTATQQLIKELITALQLIAYYERTATYLEIFQEHTEILVRLTSEEWKIQARETLHSVHV